jgi:hypothetical protein
MVAALFEGLNFFRETKDEDIFMTHLLERRCLGELQKILFKQQ